MAPRFSFSSDTNLTLFKQAVEDRGGVVHSCGTERGEPDHFIPRDAFEVTGLEDQDVLDIAFPLNPIIHW